MMTREGAKSREQVQLVSLDELVPAEHLVRKLEAGIDWSFIYGLAEDKYSQEPCFSHIFWLFPAFMQKRAVLVP